MNTVTHVLKKDIRYTRILLGVWLFLVVFQCAVMGHNTKDAVIWILYPMQWLILITIIPRVVHADPLVGTTAFWFTRPISRLTLLTSKTLYVLLTLVLLPLLVKLILMAANGATVHDMALGAAEIAMGQVALILAVAIVAVITSSFGRFALVWSVSLVALLLLLYFLGTQTAHHSTPPEPYSLIVSRFVVCFLIWFFAAGGMIAHQYLTRKTWLTAGVAGTGALVTLFLTLPGIWTWDFLKPRVQAAGDANIDAGAIKTSLMLLERRQDGTSPYNAVWSGIDIAGVPKGYALTVAGVHPHLTSTNGAAPQVNLASDDASAGEPDNGGLAAALGGPRLVNVPVTPDQARGDYTDTIWLNGDASDREAAMSAKFSATVDFVLYGFVKTGEMPLEKGARYDHESEHLLITGIRKHKADLIVDARQRALNLFLTVNDMPGSAQDHVRYVLVNRKRNEAFMQDQQYRDDGWLVNRKVGLKFAPNNGDHSLLPPKIDGKWLADARLERYDWLPVAVFSRELTAGPGLGGGQKGNQEQKPDANALGKITLPANATRVQAEAYVDAVILQSRNQTSFGENDPEVGMLEAVGRQNLGVLVDLAKRLSGADEETYATAAIRDLARPEDETLVLSALGADAELVELVMRYRWEKEARETLIGGLSSTALPVEWIRAVADLRDPSTYPALKNYLLNGANQPDTYDASKGLPGIDLSDAVDTIWNKARTGSAYEAMTAARMAAEHGHADALEIAADVLSNESDVFDRNRARTLITDFTVAAGSDEELVKWVRGHGNRLALDPKSGKYGAH